MFEAYKNQFDTYLKENLPKLTPKELHEPFEYLMHLDGKRMRPILAMMANECFEVNPEETMRIGLIIEIFHNFTLMHDDIMDKSLTRRGKPTANNKYGDNTAILSGDAMLILSYQMLEKVNPTYFQSIFSLFNTTASQICTGQQLDMNFEKEFEVSELEYLLMIELKTAVLLACSMKMGAIIGHASNEDLQHIYNYGLNTGLAFQIQDDLLDSFGETADTGKMKGGDIINNKKTLLLIKALQTNNKYDKQVLHNWLQTNEPNETKIIDILKIYEQSGARDYVIAKRNHYCQKAIDEINKSSISYENKIKLITFAQKSIERIK
jgi:geranylgeranyl diphosphate synthase type II